jgi:hypothetical protein
MLLVANVQLKMEVNLHIPRVGICTHFSQQKVFAMEELT